MGLLQMTATAKKVNGYFDGGALGVSGLFIQTHFGLKCHFGSSSLDFELLCWVEDPRFKGLEIHNLLKGIYRAFAASSITIPFPQQDVHIREMPERSEK